MKFYNLVSINILDWVSLQHSILYNNFSVGSPACFPFSSIHSEFSFFFVDMPQLHHSCNNFYNRTSLFKRTLLYITVKLTICQCYSTREQYVTLSPRYLRTELHSIQASWTMQRHASSQSSTVVYKFYTYSLEIYTYSLGIDEIVNFSSQIFCQTWASP